MRFSPSEGIKSNVRIFGRQSAKLSLSELAWDGEMVGSGQDRRFCIKKERSVTDLLTINRLSR
jgi:hypothetical protein